MADNHEAVKLQTRMLADAIADAHTLFENAMLVKGMACVSCAEVFGWTVKHSAAINMAIKEPSHGQ